MRATTRAPTGDYGVVFWLRFAEWCRARPSLMGRPATVAASEICAAFNVSRATGFRWWAAWREVHPTIQGETR